MQGTQDNERAIHSNNFMLTAHTLSVKGLCVCCLLSSLVCTTWVVADGSAQDGGEGRGRVE